MVNMVFRWPKPISFMVLGLMVYIYVMNDVQYDPVHSELEGF